MKLKFAKSYQSYLKSRESESLIEMRSMEIINNEKAGQFEYRTEGHLSFLTYKMRDETMFLMYTEVPRELGGQGVGSALVLEALEYAKANNFKIAVMCSFIAHYIKKNPKWYHLYNEEFHLQMRHN